MMRNEKIWKIAEIVLGAIGAALLVLILVLKLLGKDVTPLVYPIVGVVILFLVCDEIARSIRRKREKAEAEKAQAAPAPETELPKEAFEFEEKSEEPKP